MKATTITVKVMAHFWAGGTGGASGTGGVILSLEPCSIGYASAERLDVPPGF
jgi:hypothetical protein